MPTALVILLPLLDETPEPEDVKAGPVALLIFVLGILAVVVLAFSFVKQMRKVDSARKAGVYGDDDSTGDDTGRGTAPEAGSSTDPGSGADPAGRA